MSYQIHITNEEYLEIIEMYRCDYEYVDMEKNNGEYFTNEHALNKLMGFYKKIVEEYINYGYDYDCINRLSKCNFNTYDDVVSEYDELVRFYMFVSYISTKNIYAYDSMDRFEETLRSEIIDKVVIKCCKLHFKNCIEKIRVAVYDFLPNDIVNICIEYAKE